MKDSDGKAVGCHKTKKQALKHLAALVLNVKEDNMNNTEDRGATTFADLPIHPDRKRSYIEAEVLPRVRKWASSDGSGDKDKIDWVKFRKAFFWYEDRKSVV